MNTDNHLQKTNVAKEFLIKSFDRLRTNGKLLIPFVVSPSATLRRALSNHEWNQLVQSFPKSTPRITAKQKGATLFTALIFLIMLSLLGLNAAQMSTLEERMSGNTRSRDLAFQAAEAALKHVEQNLASGENIHLLIPAPTNTTSGTVAAAGLRAINVCLPNSADYWNGNGAPDCTGTTQQYAWSSTTARTPSHSLNQVASQPMYVVERLPNVGTTEKYRVTARGVGGDSAAVVILQAMFSY
jgi:type IV pilus assembly protein PilX